MNIIAPETDAIFLQAACRKTKLAPIIAHMFTNQNVDKTKFFAPEWKTPTDAQWRDIALITTRPTPVHHLARFIAILMRNFALETDATSLTHASQWMNLVLSTAHLLLNQLVEPTRPSALAQLMPMDALLWEVACTTTQNRNAELSVLFIVMLMRNIALETEVISAGAALR